MFKKLTLLILLTAQISLADCLGGVKYNRSSFENDRGLNIIYSIEPDQINTNMLACIVGSEFLAAASNFPERMLVGLVSKDLETFTMIQIDILKDRFTLVSIENEIGSFITYPQPLQRIKEIFIQKKFPTQKELGPVLRRKFSANTVIASKEMIRMLINGN